VYRLYIALSGLYSDKNKFFSNDIKEIFDLINSSIKETNEYTKYNVIDTDGGDHSILLFFNDRGDKMMGLDNYDNFKSSYEGKAKTLKRRNY
jgi:hypothetical protein